MHDDPTTAAATDTADFGADIGPAGAAPALRLRGRSFMALVLTPDPPLAAWVAALDAAIERAASFFVGRPVVLDLGLLAPGTAGLADLPDQLRARRIRVIATENADAADAHDGFPETLSGGRATGDETLPEAAAPAVLPEPAPARHALVLDAPVRSGTQVIFPDGDVTVIGSVASGAEVMAGGSIHVYGALRGRAIAGFGGRPDARVICQRLEAELIAIDGYYLIADDMADSLRGMATQALLDGDQIALRPLVGG